MLDKWGICSRDEFYEFVDRVRSVEFLLIRYLINFNGYFYKRVDGSLVF